MGGKKEAKGKVAKKSYICTVGFKYSNNVPSPDLQHVCAR